MGSGPDRPVLLGHRVLPSKDGFYSSSLPQVGGQTVGPEKNPDREALFATLSGAFVGPMDGIELLNKTRVMQSCRADGRVLKPDQPVLASDACFLQPETLKPEDCRLYRAFSDLTSALYGRVHYFFEDAPQGQTDIEQGLMLQGTEKPHVVSNWYTGELSLLAQGPQALAPGYEGHAYAVVAPVVECWALLGEPGKFVSASNLRVQAFQPSYCSDPPAGSELDLTLVGVPGEEVEFCAAWVHRSQAPVKFCAAGTVSPDGRLQLSFSYPSVLVV